MPSVMVVDDEVEVAKALRRVLRREGFEVEIAFDGASALEALARFHPDLVIADYRMPNMNGVELVREINRRSPATACLMLSGYADFASPSQPVGGGICEVLNKPWNDQQLLASIRTAIAARSEMRS